MLQRCSDRLFHTAAAGYFHADDGNAFDIVCKQDLSQLAAVIFVVQLGTADKRDMVFYEFTVEIAVGEGGTVGGNQQPAVLQVGCVRVDQLDLDRSLLQLAVLGRGCLLLWCRFLLMQ